MEKPSGTGAGPGTVGSRPSARRILPDLVAGLVPLGLTTGTMLWALRLPGPFVVGALALYAVHAGLILRAAPPGLPGPGFGPANRVTLLRATLTLPVAALTLVPGAPGAAVAWAAILLGSVSLVLDGVDGAVARRTGTSSAFGARYDMELDALFMLALSLLVWESGRAGPWVILIGALRYVFLGAGWLWPPLRAPLPASFRRKAVCVVQGVALVVALAPIVPDAPAAVVVAVALGLLVGSFGIDVAWLLAYRPTVRPGGPGTSTVGHP